MALPTRPTGIKKSKSYPLQLSHEFQTICSLILSLVLHCQPKGSSPANMHKVFDLKDSKRMYP